MADKFRVTHAVWLQTETARVKDIIIGIKYWGVKWTHAKLRSELAGIGLMYSPAEIAELNDALHTAGVVEDIVESVATPE